MKYERGFIQLQRQLKKENETEVLKQLEVLRLSLNSLLRHHAFSNDLDVSQSYRQVLTELDKLAYRNVGKSFESLCSHSPSVKSALSLLSLKAVFSVLVVFLSLCTLSVALASARVGITRQQMQIEEIRRNVQRIDERINDSVTSSFYLKNLFPCPFDNVMGVKRMSGLIVTGDDTNCSWEYIDSDSLQLIAKDYWGFHLDPLLQKREYYDNGMLIAQDTFGFQGGNCFKHRELLDNAGQIIDTTCFSEAGMLTAGDLRDSLRSPIPPMLYWFFYR